MNDRTHDLDVPAEKTIYVVDMRKYSQLQESQMESVRMDLDALVAEAFADSGITADRVELDTGDGAIFILPPAQMWRLIDPLTANLDLALRTRARDQPGNQPGVAVRTSVHVGPLSDQNRGEAINHACRLVNSETAYRTMDAAVEYGAHVGLTLSELAFRRTILAGRRLALTEADFVDDRALVSGKDDFDERAWTHVPGLKGLTLRKLAGFDSNATAGAVASSIDQSPALPGGVHFHGGVGAVNGSVTELRQTNNF